MIDEAFLADLPPTVDPCGENGEFHTFVFDGPNFSAPVRFEIGDIVCRDSFWFCDLVPESGNERTKSC
jgi:diphthamide synthase (EF-2-diphthine--ammonia ligase)